MTDGDPTADPGVRSEIKPGCGCATCDEARRAVFAEQGDWIRAISRPFIVCVDCGNKRCPRASFHGHDCTGSNEPGQPGSFYPSPPAPAAVVNDADLENDTARTQTAADYVRNLRQSLTADLMQSAPLSDGSVVVALPLPREPELTAQVQHQQDQIDRISGALLRPGLYAGPRRPDEPMISWQARAVRSMIVHPSFRMHP